MKIEAPSFSFSLGRLFCTLFGHNYRISKKITNHIKEYRCEHCGEEITNTANGLFEKLTPKFRETNDYLAQIHRRRTRKAS